MSAVVSPLARHIYKRIMWAARDYPGGSEKIRSQAKAAIRRHRDEGDPAKIKELMVRLLFVYVHGPMSSARRQRLTTLLAKSMQHAIFTSTVTFDAPTQLKKSAFSRSSSFNQSQALTPADLSFACEVF